MYRYHRHLQACNCTKGCQYLSIISRFDIEALRILSYVLVVHNCDLARHVKLIFVVLS
jgi:hypothetical protein